MIQRYFAAGHDVRCSRTVDDLLIPRRWSRARSRARFYTRVLGWITNRLTSANRAEPGADVLGLLAAAGRLCCAGPRCCARPENLAAVELIENQKDARLRLSRYDCVAPNVGILLPRIPVVMRAPGLREEIQQRWHAVHRAAARAGGAFTGTL